MNNTQIAVLILFVIGVSMALKEKICIFSVNNNAMLDNISNKRKFTMLLPFIIFLILLACFRDVKMADYQEYKYSITSPFYYGNREPFFHLIRYISSLSSSPWLIASLLFASISIGLKFYTINKISPFVWGSIIIYLSYLYVAQDLIAIRSACASAFLLPIIIHKRNKEYIKALVAIIFSILFHYSAFIFLVILFLDNKKTHRLFFLCAIGISYFLNYKGINFGSILALFDFNFLEKDFSIYNTQESINVYNAIQMVRLLMCLLSWFFISKLKQIHPLSLLLVKVYTISIIAFVLFSDLISVAVRFQELFLFVETVLIPILCISIFYRRTYFAKLAVVLYASMSLFFITIFNKTFWGIL